MVFVMIILGRVSRAICGVTRPQYQANGEPKCAGRQKGFERFIEPDDVPDSKGG